MAKAIKFLSIFALFFVLFLMLLGRSVNADAYDKCLKAYDEGYTLTECQATPLYPSACYYECKEKKGAKSGYCIQKEDGKKFICVCDFCKSPYSPL